MLQTNIRIYTGGQISWFNSYCIRFGGFLGNVRDSYEYRLITESRNTFCQNDNLSRINVFLILNVRSCDQQSFRALLDQVCCWPPKEYIVSYIYIFFLFCYGYLEITRAVLFRCPFCFHIVTTKGLRCLKVNISPRE